ncbi:MAG: hypothetical protein WBL61_22520 [Bryobacteraceae bacterium]
MGFSLVGWFPMQEFQACRAWRSVGYVTPEAIEPQAFRDDHLGLLREGEIVGDDMIRGACPGQVAIPWLPGIAGCRVRVLQDSILGEEQCLPLDQASSLALDRDNPWFRKYVEFGLALVGAAEGRFLRRCEIFAPGEGFVFNAIHNLQAGAPVTQQYADRIGADGYSDSAGRAVALARKLVAA